MTSTLDLGSPPLEEVISEIFKLVKCSTKNAEGLCLETNISNSLKQERVQSVVGANSTRDRKWHSKMLENIARNRFSMVLKSH